MTAHRAHTHVHGVKCRNDTRQILRSHSEDTAHTSLTKKAKQLLTTTAAAAAVATAASSPTVTAPVTATITTSAIA
jgi:hypothetical protein